MRKVSGLDKINSLVNCCLTPESRDFAMSKHFLRRETSLVASVPRSRRSFRWLFVAATTIVISSGFVLPVQAGVLSRIRDAIGSLWGERAEKHNAAAGARGRAASMGRQANTIADRLEDAQREFLRATAVHENLSHQLRRTEAKIVITQRRVQVATKRYDAHRHLLGQRLAAMQRTGRLGYLQLMLSARSLTELSRRAYYFNSVAARDADLKEQLQADREELERTQNILMAQWNERRQLASSANRQLRRVASVAAQQEHALRELNSNRFALLSYANAQDQSAREIEGMIGELSARRAALAAQQAQSRRAFVPRASRFRGRRAERGVAPLSGSNLAPMPIREVAYYNAMRPADSADGGTLRDSLSTESGHEGHDHGNESSSAWAMPVRGRLSSRFGMRFHPILQRRKLHTGDDVAAKHGAPFRAARRGTVLWAGWKKAYGNTVIVDHGDGVCTLYGHASKLSVAAGQNVNAGQYIGNVGSTGWSTGSHLHFEVRKNGKPVNPKRYLRGR